MSELLKRLGWSQAYFADHIEVDPRTVGRWVSGKSRTPGLVIRYLNQCCRLIGV